MKIDLSFTIIENVLNAIHCIIDQNKDILVRTSKHVSFITAIIPKIKFFEDKESILNIKKINGYSVAIYDDFDIDMSIKDCNLFHYGTRIPFKGIHIPFEFDVIYKITNKEFESWERNYKESVVYYMKDMIKRYKEAYKLKDTSQFLIAIPEMMYNGADKYEVLDIDEIDNVPVRILDIDKINDNAVYIVENKYMNIYETKYAEKHFCQFRENGVQLDETFGMYILHLF